MVLVGVSQSLPNSLTCLPHPLFHKEWESQPLPKKREEQDAQIREPLLVGIRNPEIHFRCSLSSTGKLYLLKLKGHPESLESGPSEPLVPLPAGWARLPYHTQKGLCDPLSQPRHPQAHSKCRRTTISWPGSRQQQKNVLWPVTLLPADVTAAWPQVTKNKPLILVLKL